MYVDSFETVLTAVPLRTVTRTIIVATGITLALTGCNPLPAPDDEAMPSPTNPEGVSFDVTAAGVVDGDTIRIDPGDAADVFPVGENGTHPIRLLGIDAPEMNAMSDQAPQCGAQEASDHLATMVHEGQTVTVTFDDEAQFPPRDQYGRTLAYVNVDGQDLGGRQIRDGYATSWWPASAPAPQRSQTYTDSHNAAQERNVGLWATCDTAGKARP